MDVPQTRLDIVIQSLTSHSETCLFLSIKSPQHLFNNRHPKIFISRTRSQKVTPDGKFHYFTISHIIQLSNSPPMFIPTRLVLWISIFNPKIFSKTRRMFRTFLDFCWSANKNSSICKLMRLSLPTLTTFSHLTPPSSNTQLQIKIKITIDSEQLRLNFSY